jgi:hypothetical protein
MECKTLWLVETCWISRYGSLTVVGFYLRQPLPDGLGRKALRLARQRQDYCERKNKPYVRLIKLMGELDD